VEIASMFHLRPSVSRPRHALVNRIFQGDKYKIASYLDDEISDFHDQCRDFNLGYSSWR